MASIRRRCAACKSLRRKCPPNCIFSPYFPSDYNPKKFACVHRIYGAKNVAKMLQDLPADQCAAAADAMEFEAQCRIEEPVYGCAGIISQLHQEIRNAETELAQIQAQIAMIVGSNTINVPDRNSSDHILQLLESDLNRLV